MTLDEAQNKIKKEKLTRADINKLKDVMHHDEWLPLRIAKNDMDVKNTKDMLQLIYTLLVEMNNRIIELGAEKQMKHLTKFRKMKEKLEKNGH